MPPPPPLGTKNNSSNSSPKWQANYSGNMSPRYSNDTPNGNSSSLNSSNSSRNGSNPKTDNNNSKSLGAKGNHQQRMAPLNNNRPVTPIPPNQNNRNRELNYNKNPSSSSSVQHQLPPTNKPQIMPLMSFNSGSISSNSSQETPSSPPISTDPIETNLPTKLIPIIPEIKPIISTPYEPECKSSHSASLTSAPPDSPTSESIPVFIPKVIPLERNFNSEASSLSKEPMKNVTKKGNTMTSKLKSVDIASPDAVVDDNLIIDLPNHNT